MSRPRPIRARCPLLRISGRRNNKVIDTSCRQAHQARRWIPEGENSSASINICSVNFFAPGVGRLWNKTGSQNFAVSGATPGDAQACRWEGAAEHRGRKMATLKTLALAAVFAGSTSLAFAQGPGIGPEGNVLPPQTNTHGTAASPAIPEQSTHAVKKHHRLYNMYRPSKKTDRTPMSK
jgi:hypothetical protein